MKATSSERPLRDQICKAEQEGAIRYRGRAPPQIRFGALFSFRRRTLMAGRVEGKVAAVTGAARGQGRSHCIRLAEEGADIIALDVCAPVASTGYEMATSEDLDRTVEAVETLGRRIIATEVDVRNLAALKAAVDHGVAELGRLDIVSANAGIAGYGRVSAHEIDAKSWNEMIDINLSGVWNTTTATTPHIVAGNRGGSIVLTSSVAGLKGIAHLGHYVTAKHGVVGLMRSLALELAPLSIRVNTIHPSAVNTDMIHNESIYALYRPDLDHPTIGDVKEVFVNQNLLPISWLEPVDVSNAVLFLASEEARYITGITLPIDAGATIK